MTDYTDDNAKNELKRADHLLYVSLKYTRTADVIKSIIKRLISAIDFIFLETCEYLKEKGKIKAVPDSKKDRIETIQKFYKKQDINDYIDLYFLLRELDKADFGKKEEYRKHVTLIAHLPQGDFNVDVPMVIEYFSKTREFIHLMYDFMKK